jgi:hypothetical protein
MSRSSNFPYIYQVDGRLFLWKVNGNLRDGLNEVWDTHYQL